MKHKSSKKKKLCTSDKWNFVDENIFQLCYLKKIWRVNLSNYLSASSTQMHDKGVSPHFGGNHNAIYKGIKSTLCTHYTILYANYISIKLKRNHSHTLNLYPPQKNSSIIHKPTTFRNSYLLFQELRAKNSGKVFPKGLKDLSLKCGRSGCLRFLVALSGLETETWVTEVHIYTLLKYVCAWDI